MRVIGGKYRSRVLASFEGDNGRPTADRVKESLFNILSLRFYGARVLDLFSGSGSLGIESLSRGAGEVVFNDVSKDSIAILRKNLKTLNIAEGAGVRVHTLDAQLCLTAQKEPFDIIFIDPPYRLECGVEAIKTIAAKRLLKEDGVLVFERDRSFEGEIDGLEAYDERKYGKTFLTFFRVK